MPMQAADSVYTIEIDERLDLRFHRVFTRACELAEDADAAAIEVDLANTRQVNDSGLAMLLMLLRRAKLPRERMRLLNCHPEVRSRLCAHGLGGHFAFQGAA
jgi:anti-anti-sigma regulatory factor